MVKFRVPSAVIVSVAALAVLFPADAFAQGWTPTGGGDHGGADWTAADGDVIGGVHINIGIFRVPAGATVTVQPWDGTQFGEVDITAEVVTIEGTLSAN